MDIDKFLDIEQKYKLYDIEVDGVNYWIYHRFRIWNYKICASSLGLNTNYAEKNKNFIKKIKNIRYFFNRKLPKNIDVLFLNHERRIKNNKFYDCMYTEELSSCFSNSVTFEIKFKDMHFKPTRTKNLYYLDKINFEASLYFNIIKKFNRKKYNSIKNKIKSQIQEPLSEFGNTFDWKYSEKKLLDTFTNTVLRNKFMYKKYLKLVKKINPKVIVEVVSYSYSKMLFNEVAKQLNIPVIELQHGTMYKEHIAYQYKTKNQIKQFPNKIFLFSDFWKKNINPPISNKNLISTGYPFFDSKLKEYKNVSSNNNRRKTILFISQGTIGAYLSKLACDLSKKIDNKKYRIIFKLHPSECLNWKDTYKELYESSIEVIDNNNESIYYYFNQSDIQIGVYSTALYEGIGFGLKTLIYKVGHYDVMESLVNENYAKYIENVDDILNILNKNNINKLNNRQNFWKNDSLNTMIKYISKYINTN